LHFYLNFFYLNIYLIEMSSNGYKFLQPAYLSTEDYQLRGQDRPKPTQTRDKRSRELPTQPMFIDFESTQSKSNRLPRRRGPSSKSIKSRAPSIVPQCEDKDPEYLFNLAGSVPANSMHIKKIKGTPQEYELFLELESEKVIKYTDRPYHESTIISIKELISYFKKGGEFNDVNPNAILTIGRSQHDQKKLYGGLVKDNEFEATNGYRTIPITINNIKIDSNIISINFNILDVTGKSSASKYVSSGNDSNFMNSLQHITHQNLISLSIDGCGNCGGGGGGGGGGVGSILCMGNRTCQYVAAYGGIPRG
jgi:hypothetical protein